jgi:hypothetical protein
MSLGTISLKQHLPVPGTSLHPVEPEEAAKDPHDMARVVDNAIYMTD